MKCDCNQYDFNESVQRKKDYWEFQRDVFMGKLYKCSFCNSLWAAYMGGHGWTLYYKKPDDTEFSLPEKTLEDSKCEVVWNDFVFRAWDEIVKMLPPQEEGYIGKQFMPSDVMTVLQYLFDNEKEIHKWLFTERESSLGFETPIKVMNEGDGLNLIKVVLKEKAERKIFDNGNV